MSTDDLIRRDVINEILCQHSLGYAEIEHKHNIVFYEYFEREMEALKDLNRDGILDISHDRMTVTPLGKIFITHVCKVFDYYLNGNEVYQITGP